MRLILSVLTIVITLIFSSYNSYAQSKGGRWQFENNGFDTADWDAVDNPGALQGQAGFSNEIPLGEGSACLLLDTAYVHDYFRVEDSPDLDFDSEDIGISAWIYPYVLNDVHYLVNKGRQDSNPITTNYAIRISKSKHLEFLIRDVSNNRAQTVASSFTIPVNQWTFVGVFYDFGAGKVYMWNSLDAPAADTLDFATVPVANDDPLGIGSWYRADQASPSIKDFEGRMDDVRISGRLEDVIPTVTGIQEDRLDSFPEEDVTMDVYPNPVSLSTLAGNVRIQVKTVQSEPVLVSIYNILGQRVFTTTIQGMGQNGTYSWNLRDEMGNVVRSGIYFVRVKGKKQQKVQRILILK